MKDSSIAWCHHSQNFWVGCTEVSPECAGCYARSLVEQKKQRFHVLRLTQTWGDAYKLNATAAREGKCALVFASSMTDFWHPDADLWRADAWQVIRECQNLVWLLLTKRPERIERDLPSDWEHSFKHCWLGTTCGVRSSYPRIDVLRCIPCSKRFLSIEPLLEQLIDINLEGIDWALVGGMSGKLWREKEMQMLWVLDLYQATRRSGTKFFWKQVAALQNEWGSNAFALYLADQEGRWADPKTVELVREFPETALPLMDLNTEKGHRFTRKEWQDYMTRQIPF